jgi:mono/diheme cytochrome c family protein
MLTVLVLAGACAAPTPTTETGAPAAPAPAPYEDTTVTLPAGDPAEGREAFQILRCTACHEVAGEAGFQAPVSDSRGPVLDAAMARRPASYVATAIVSPSHSMSTSISDELKARLSEGGTLSPMGDFSRAMTVRQLIDVVAYLQSVEASN